MKTIITLTSHPDRWDTPAKEESFKEVIDSIVTQTAEVDDVYLRLCKRYARLKLDCSEEDIPDWLTQYDTEGKLSIKWGKDYGPFTKLRDTLNEADDDTNIVVVDDDKAYHRDLVKFLLYWKGEFKDVAIGFGGRALHPHPMYKLQYNYAKLITHQQVAHSPELRGLSVHILRGTDGMLLNKSMFEVDGKYPVLENWKDAIMKTSELFFVDDLWVAGNLAKAETAKVVVPIHTNKLAESGIAKDLGNDLWDINQGSGGATNNDVALRYFSEYWEQ